MTFPDATAIGTMRLGLDPLRVGDADEMAVVLAAPSLYEHTGGTPPTAPELRERYAAQVRGASADGSQAWRNWIVRERDGPAVGFVQATVTANGTEADVAWVIGEPWQGRGYASEAARALIEWLGANGVRTVTAHIHPDNEASARVADRVGLRPTLVMEDGELVWRTVLDPRLPTPAERRRRLSSMNVLVGLGIAGFALYEIAMVRAGELQGGPDQWVRDGVLILAGGALVLGGLLMRRRAARA